MDLTFHRREVDLAVISDVHLGTPACRAEDLLAYLKSIRPGKLVLNGDIVDMQQFDRRYWPDSHTKVVRRVLKFAANGTPVFYVTGNHEHALRRYSNAGFDFGQLHLVDRLEWNIDGMRTLVTHGDHCDERMGANRLLARFGSWAYDRIEHVGNLVNSLRRGLGWRRVSLTRSIKHRLASATAWIDRFEEMCAETAVRGGFDTIICGHIHQPAIRHIAVGEERPLYLNSGDWVENGTALEYAHGRWQLVRFDQLVEEGVVFPQRLEETRAVG
jgi:UDP-2,3-diacylglucosamine pyrophosphatase LpxH